MPYSTASIANAILNKAAEGGAKVSPLKLQKLLYYACGYFQAAYKESLIDHTFEAWDYGPVVPPLYHQFKKFGLKPITEPAVAYDPAWETVGPAPIPTGDKRVEKVIDFVWNTYGKFSALQLSDMTHAPNSPWDRARKDYPGMRGVDIPPEYLEVYFGKFVRKPAANAAG